MKTSVPKELLDLQEVGTERREGGVKSKLNHGCHEIVVRLALWKGQAAFCADRKAAAH